MDADAEVQLGELVPVPLPWSLVQCFIKTLLNGRSRFGLSVADIYNDLLELQPAIIHRIVFHCDYIHTSSVDF